MCEARGHDGAVGALRPDAVTVGCCLDVSLSGGDGVFEVVLGVCCDAVPVALDQGCEAEVAYAADVCGERDFFCAPASAELEREGFGRGVIVYAVCGSFAHVGFEGGDGVACLGAIDDR